MNLSLLYEHDFIEGDFVRLTDRRFEHIRNVLKAQVGDRITVGRLGGLCGHGIIESLDDQSVELRITLTEHAPAKQPLTLLLALPRPKMLRRIFRSVAELGVEELILLNCYKVEKSYWQSPALQEEKIREYFCLGLEQAKDTVLPKIRIEKRFKPFVEDHLPELLEQRRGIVAHPGEGLPCSSVDGEAALLAIGPEGGFTPYEVGKLKEAGCEGVHLGERILRVENAIATLIAKLY